MLRVIAPKGINAVQISNMSYEGELLLDRDLLFRVVRDYGDNKEGMRILDVEVISRSAQRRKVS